MNAKKPQKFEPGSLSHLAEVIEAANRPIKDYLFRQHLSLWHPISTAPNNHDLELKVLDGESSVVTSISLPANKCRRVDQCRFRGAHRYPTDEMASLAKSKSAQAPVQHRARFSSPQRTALER